MTYGLYGNSLFAGNGNNVLKVKQCHKNVHVTRIYVWTKNLD